MPDGAEKLVFSSRIGNSADSGTRTFAAAISEDGKTYKVLKEVNFFPKPGYIECEYDIKGKKTVYIRFIRKIAKGDSAAYGFGALFKEFLVRCTGKYQGDSLN